MAGDWLEKMPEVTPGERAKGVMTSARFNAMRDAMLEMETRLSALDGGGRRPIQRSNRRPRFQIWFEPALKRLYVTEGTAADGSAGWVTPMVPTIGGADITDDPAPYIDCSAVDVAKTWLVTAVVFAGEVKIELIDQAAVDPVAAEGARAVWVLAEVKFQEVGEGGMAVETFMPRWNSDIPAGGATPPFAPRSALAKGTGREVVIEPGWLIDIITEGFVSSPGFSRLYYMPVANPNGDGGPEKPLNAAVPPAFLLGVGDTLCLAYESDDKGVVKNEGTGDKKPRIIVVSDPEDLKGVHYQPKNPEDGSEGTEGVYRIRLLELTVGGLVVYQNSDVEHYHELPTLVNVGSGARMFKQRNHPSDIYEFRRLLGRYGTKITENTDELPFDFDGKNHGTGVDVWAEPGDVLDGGEADFRTIRGGIESDNDAGGTRDQIVVEPAPADGADDPDAEPREFAGIRVVGNGFFKDAGATKYIKQLEISDGLVTGFEEADEPGSVSGKNLDLTVTQKSYSRVEIEYKNWFDANASRSDIVIVGSDPVTSSTTYHWRNGLYVGCSDDNGGTFDPDSGSPPADLVTEDVDNWNDMS